MSTALTTGNNLDGNSDIHEEGGALFVDPLPDATKHLDKQVSLIEKTKKKSKMSYKSTDLHTISRHLSESVVEPAKQNYEDLVSCSVCFDVFDSVNQSKLPKILPCQHTYCVECIKNLIHCSNERSFNCPQCKYKIDNVNDASSLPTSRIVLTLLEKESLNYQGYASCPCCRQIRNLEVCFECNLPLCNQCIGKHFETWKNEITQSCLVAEENLEKYKQKIDVVNPLITQNFELVQEIKNSIEDACSILIQRINTEKDILLRTVNEIKDNNAKYVNFKKELLALLASFKVFRESNDTFEKKLMNARIKKCQQNFEQAQKFDKEYVSLASTHFKLLERFEKRPLPELDFNISGNLLISEMSLEQNRPPTSSISSAPSPSIQMQRSNQQQNLNPSRLTIPKIEALSANNNSKKSTSVPPDMARSTLTRSSGAHLASTLAQSNSRTNLYNTADASSSSYSASNTDSLSKWILNSSIKPHSEVTVSNSVNLITSYENLLFTMDSNSFLTIYEKVYAAELKTRNSLKLNIPNIKAIACNSCYVAVAYSSLKKDQLKGALKYMNPSGVVLYRREQHVVCSVHEKQIELGKNESFKTINGIALTDKYAFVCEKETRIIYQFDLKNGRLLNSAELDGEPYSISANQAFFCVTDSANSILYMFNSENLETINTAIIKSIDQLNGQMSVLLTEENLIFIRNADNQITLLNSKFEHCAYFNEIQARLINITLLKDSNQMLVIACQNNKQQFKLLSYVA